MRTSPRSTSARSAAAAVSASAAHSCRSNRSRNRSSDSTSTGGRPVLRSGKGPAVATVVSYGRPRRLTDGAGFLAPCAARPQRAHIGLASERRPPDPLIWREDDIRINLTLEPGEESGGRGGRRRAALSVQRERADPGAEPAL